MNINLFYGLNGRTVTPCDPLYNKDRQGWNRAVQKFPSVISYCTNTNDVSSAVNWSTRNGIPLRIRSGGHNYEGYSNGNGVLVIDVSEMDAIELDEQTGVVRMQPGALNEQIYSTVSSRGYPFPGGLCPTVAVSGFALGGGWGLSCRYLGLGCDSLEEIEIVNCEGRIIKANTRCNPDLFWACRGAGGGNFGVVTQLTFRLPPQSDMVTLVELAYPNASNSEMEQFIGTWQQWLVGLDDRITLRAGLYNSSIEGRGIYSVGLFYGTIEEAGQILQPFADIPGGTISLEAMTFLQAIQIIEQSYPSSEKFQNASGFANRHYSQPEIKNIVELIDQRAEGSVTAAVSLYALGGKVREVAPSATAFYYRNAAYIMTIQSVWEDNQYACDNRQWVYERYRYLSGITDGAFVNFPYNCLTEYGREYYGENMTRLRLVKCSYDPGNVFCFPQSIR